MFLYVEGSSEDQNLLELLKKRFIILHFGVKNPGLKAGALTISINGRFPISMTATLLAPCPWLRAGPRRAGGSLIADVGAYHRLLRPAHGPGEVAIAPEALAPQELFQVRELRPQYAGTPPLERLHHLRDAGRRRHLKQQMHADAHGRAEHSARAGPRR